MYVIKLLLHQISTYFIIYRQNQIIMKLTSLFDTVDKKQRITLN